MAETSWKLTMTWFEGRKGPNGAVMSEMFATHTFCESEAVAQRTAENARASNAVPRNAIDLEITVQKLRQREKGADWMPVDKPMLILIETELEMPKGVNLNAEATAEHTSHYLADIRTQLGKAEGPMAHEFAGAVGGGTIVAERPFTGSLPMANFEDVYGDEGFRGVQPEAGSTVKRRRRGQR